MLHLDSAPELTLKAYHGRVMVAFLAVCAESAQSALGGLGVDPDLDLTVVCCQLIAKWHLKLELYNRYLSRAEADELSALSLQFLRVYRSLAQQHAARGSLCWPLRPKHHAYQELNRMMSLQLYNARFRHCFRDEDQMGQVKNIARRVHRSVMEVRTLCRVSLKLKACPALCPREN